MKYFILNFKKFILKKITNKEIVAYLILSFGFVIFFLIGYSIYYISSLFNLNIFLTEFIMGLICSYVFFKKTHMGSVLFIGLVLSLLNGIIWSL
jgi:hypothetical protein